MISFVILNYGNFNDTIDCIKSIKNLKKSYMCSIIVVDNNTLSHNDITILKQYTKDIVLLNHNFGFANANNIGIRYAVENYNPNLVCVINNDIIINQTNFIYLIEHDYEKYNFDLLGTKIDSTSHESVNPFPVITDIESVKKELEKCNILIDIYSSSLLFLLLKIFLKIKHIFIRIKKPVNGCRLQKNVALHCCAIVFSKNYLMKYKDAFDSRTFLFHEEEFIYQRIINDKLTSIYDPNIFLFHKEGSSLKKNHNNERIRKLFREKERIKSLNILLNDLEGGKHEK